MEAYLLHDANAGSNLKLMIMIQEEGMKGYGIYWTVLEFLRLQNEYKASLKVIPILAQKARVTTATLKRIIYDYALFEVNETSFSSPGLSRRMEPWDAQQEAKKEAGRRGGLVNQQRIRDAKTSSALANKLNKENKETPSLSPQGETGRRKEEILLTPPEYTLNRQTHNYQGLRRTGKAESNRHPRFECHPETDRFWKTGRENLENPIRVEQLTPTESPHRDARKVHTEITQGLDLIKEI